MSRIEIIDLIKPDLIKIIEENNLYKTNKRREFAYGRLVFSLKLYNYISLAKLAPIFGYRDHSTFSIMQTKYNKGKLKQKHLDAAFEKYTPIINELLEKHNLIAKKLQNENN